MEKELIELFQAAKKAADAAAVSGGADSEASCLDALKRLKDFPVNYQLLVSTQVGKNLRKLTKHPRAMIQDLASEVVDIWKDIIISQTDKKKQNGSLENGHSLKAESATSESEESTKLHRVNSVKVEKASKSDILKANRDHPAGQSSQKKVKLETSASEKKAEFIQVKNEKNKIGGPVKVEKITKEENSGLSTRPATDASGPPKLTSLVYCKDSIRDKVRELLAEALCKVPGEVDEDLKDVVNACDPYRIAVMVETAMFEKWGKSNGAQKFKYRSIMFNIKDPNNPDFRRKVLIGQFEPRSIPELTPEDMASDARQKQNEKIKEKALFECERGKAPQASTDQFRCGRCGKKETTYYQLQIRSADEPMTTFITCCNCSNRWKIN